MAVRIRLTRVGATKRPSYRVVAIDSRRPRDGRSLEILGFYDPLTEPATVKLDAERLDAWIAKGAKPSDSVGRLMRQAGMASAPPVPVSAPTKATAEAAAQGEGDQGIGQGRGCRVRSRPASRQRQQRAGRGRCGGRTGRPAADASEAETTEAAARS